MCVSSPQEDVATSSFLVCDSVGSAAMDCDPVKYCGTELDDV